MVEISCYYSLSSPWAYLGGPRLAEIVRKRGAKLVLKPFDFQDVVPRTGGIPIRTRPEPRRSYHALELARWRDYLGMPLNLEPAYYPKGAPVDPNWNKYPGWMVIAAQLQGLDAQPDPVGLRVRQQLLDPRGDRGAGGAQVAIARRPADEHEHRGPERGCLLDRAAVVRARTVGREEAAAA